MYRSLLIVVALMIVGSLAIMTTRTCAGQDPAADGREVRVVLTDGTRYVGTIIRETDASVELRTLTGVTVTIPRDQIDRIEDSARPGKRLLREDPNSTRLLFAPTGRSLKAGEGYISLYEVLFPFVAVGAGDIATLAGGLSLVPGAKQQLLYFAPKITVHDGGNTAFALGTFVATLTGDGGYGGLLYAVASRGSPQQAITGGVGFLFGDGEFVETPIFLVGGEYQISNNVKVLTENYVIPEAEGAVVFSGGIRFIGDAISGDFGLFTSSQVLDEAGFPFLPWLGVSYKFGR